MAIVDVMIAPRMKILIQAPDVKASRIWPPAFAPAWARKISSPSSAITWQVVKGRAVAIGPIRPIRPKIRPTMSVPAAEPIEKYSPDGVDGLGKFTDRNTEGHSKAQRDRVEVREGRARSRRKIL